MSWLLLLAIVLLVIWTAAELQGWVIGPALNLLWIATFVLLAIWLFNR